MAEIDDYNFPVKIGSQEFPFAGYVSAQDPTDLQPNVVVGGSINTYKKNSGVWANRPGKKLRGEIDATNAGILSAYPWESSTDDFFILRSTEENKLQTEFEEDWYDLDIALAGKTRFIYDTWWYQTTQREIVLMGNGESNIKFFGGGNAVIDSIGASTTIATIDTTPATPGSGYVQGDIVSITGGGGTGATVRVLSIGGSGEANIVSLVNTGGGYEVTSTAATSGGTGSGLVIDILTTAVAASITKTGTESWVEAGFPTEVYQEGEVAGLRSIDINGIIYLYGGGATTTTLTGVVGTPPPQDIGARAFHYGEVDPVINNSTGDTLSDIDYEVDIIISVENQVLIASYHSPTIYISADTNFTDFVNSGAHIIGDPDFIILDDYPTALVVRDGKVIAFAGTSDSYVIELNQTIPLSFTDPIVGGTRYVVTGVQKKPGAGLSAALGQEFVDSVGDDIVYLAQDHQVRIYGSYRDLFQTKFTSLSQQIRTELEEEDFTGGSLTTVNDFIYVTAPLSGKTYLYQSRDLLNNQGNVVSERLWHAPQLWDISRIILIDGVEYGTSYSNPQIYQLWNTDQWHDDTPTGSVSYISHCVFAYWNFGDKTKLGNFNKIYYEGHLRINSDLRASIKYDYQGNSGTVEKTISSIDFTPPLFFNPSSAQLGGDLIGEGQIGGGVSPSEDLAIFRTIKSYKSINCFEYYIDVYSEQIDSRWELSVCSSNGKQVIANPVFLVSDN